MKTKQIPPDIIFDILTRIPVKSLVRFRSVSKLCSSMITAQSFAKCHLIRRPKKKPGLLITCAAKLQSAQMFFFADLNGGPAIRCLNLPPRASRYTTHSINGIVLMDFGLYATVCNPSTRQAVNLPLICPPNSPLASATYFCVNSLGFDPISKQYKVLNSWVIPEEKTHYRYPKLVEYRVFTLGTNSWRLIQAGPAFYPQRECACVDGVIYFRSWVSSRSTDQALLVGFHLQTERFCVSQIPEGAQYLAEGSHLVQFAGRLAIVDSRISIDNKVNVWISQDVSNRIWMKHTVALYSYLRKFRVFEENYFVVGTVYTGEILLAPRSFSKPFYVFYYASERHRLRRVEIIGLPEYDPLDLLCNAVTVTNYEENILSLA